MYIYSVLNMRLSVSFVVVAIYTGRTQNASQQRSRRERESTPQRAARLGGLRSRAQSARERESTPQRAARLGGLRSRARSARERESTPQREARLAGQRSRDHSRRADEQPRLRKFHEVISNVANGQCDTCSEQFPNLSISVQPNGVSECRRCAADKKIPKLCSSANNMDPGPVPPQLQVHT